MKSPLRRVVAAAALLLFVPTLAACGFGEQTDQVYQAAVGANDRSGQVFVLNALVVSETDGSGTFAGTLVNTNQNKADRLLSVTDSSGTKPIKVPAASSVNLADKGRIRVSDPAIKAGYSVQLTFQFASGQSTKMTVPVVPNTGYYANVPVGSPSPSTTPSAKSSGTSQPSESPSPTTSPSNSSPTSPTSSPTTSPTS